MKPSFFERFSSGAAAAALILLFAAPAVANSVIYTGSSVIFEGSTTGSYGLLSSRATFTSGTSGTLKLLLENTTSGTSNAPEDLLTSFYFNVLTGTTTGTPAPLGYQSAFGQVYYAVRGGVPDIPVIYTPPLPGGTVVTGTGLSNLQAFNTNDDTWQFKSGFTLGPSPALAFGVGTVGNTNLDPNSFNGNIVGGDDFGIYVGDATSSSLDGRLLVKDSIEFEFDGFSGFSLSQITPNALFGFGSDPTFVISVPEPTALVIATLGIGACGINRVRRRRMAPVGTAVVS